MRLTVAAVQMNTRLADKIYNLTTVEGHIRTAVNAGAKMVVVPELFSTGYRLDEQYADFAEPIPGPTVEKMAALAQELDIFIAACIVEKDLSSPDIYDTAFLVSPKGLEGAYRKVHLWGKEPGFFARGTELPVFETPWGLTGMMICYDVGFPEAARSLVLAGANLILMPSAFGLPRLYAWELATRARALENGCFFVTANRIGIEKDSEFCGHSRIVDPQGTVIVDAGMNEAVIVATIDLAEVVVQRGRIPYLQDRYPRAYRQESPALAADPFSPKTGGSGEAQAKVVIHKQL